MALAAECRPRSGRRDRAAVAARGRAVILSPALLAALAAAVAAVAAPAGATDEGARAQIDPASFERQVDNPWYPLKPGTTFVYRGSEDGEPSREVARVTTRKKTILGVPCVVVSDNVYVGGKLAERTLDWFAQDRKGNVWYFGEATAELDDEGRVTTTEGSWQAGRDGARPGIVMPGRPRVGQTFRQEYYRGHAEDHFEIVSLSANVKVPYVSSRGALESREWSPLEPGLSERKYYVRGVGLVKDGPAVLVTVT
jgi:hypothetical protein